MSCCLLRAKRLSIGPFLAHFEERLPLKFSDYPLHQTLIHRRCGSAYVAVFAGEDREKGAGRWIATRWVLIPLTSDELADMECTPTAELRAGRQGLIPTLRAEQWLWLTEGADRGVGKWSSRLSSVHTIAAQPVTAWPALADGVPPARRATPPSRKLLGDQAK